MVAAEKIVKELIGKGIALYLEDGSLKYKAKKGALSQSEKDRVSQNKDSIIQYLTKVSSNALPAGFMAPEFNSKERPSQIPLSFAQQRLWFIDQMGAGSKQYNMTGRYEHSGVFNMDAFEQAIHCLLYRHEVLRTCIRSVNGEPEQIVLQEYSLPLDMEDLSTLSKHEQASVIEKKFNDEASAVFDLDKDLMLRVRILKLAEENYIIFYTLHHIASDGWSLAIFYNELSQLYRAFCENKTNPLTPLSIQYADYSLWQREWLKGDLLKHQLSYWREQLAAVPLVHNLPLDKQRPAKQLFSGKMFYQTFSQSLTEKVIRLCEQHEVTSFMFLETAFAMLLGQYSGETDIVIGTPIAGRTHAELEGMIGFFVNSLAIRTDLSDNPSFTDLLARNKKTILDAYTHQHIPFEMLVEELRVTRDVRFNPIFQVVFAGQTNELSELTFSETQATAPDVGEINYSIHEMTTRFDLEAHLTEQGGRFVLQWIFSDSLFDESLVIRLAKNFEVLIEGIVLSLEDNRTSKTINELPYLHEDEKQRVLQLWDHIEEETQNYLCIHQHFEAQVEKYSSSPAITFEGISYTYAQLNACSNQLARFLISKGVRPETKVGVFLDRSAEMVLSVIAILKAGGAYVPIDPGYPKQRIDYIIEDSGVELILTQSDMHTAKDLCTEGKLIFVDYILDPVNQPPSLAQMSTENLGPETIGLSPENLAYVIYTSGSTGKPKGVLVEHKNVFRLFSAVTENFHFSQNDVWTLFHSISFDFSVWEMWGALFFGGRLVVVPQATARSTQMFYQLLIDEKVTVVNQTPGAFYQLAAEDQYRQAELSLRYVIFGGEALDVNKLKSWVSRRGDSAPQLINMYGITETTVHVTYHQIVARDLVNPKSNAIGRPLSDLKVYLLDQEQVLVPIGVIGEMYVGGAGVARGYLNREELTSSRFISNPYKEGELLYRTGDLARYTHEFELEYIGRIDEQVKIRGFRIELGEIESALSKSESLDNAVVSVHANANADGDKTLVAHVCPSSLYLTTHAKAFNRKNISDWAKVFDSTYEGFSLAGKVGNDFSGWNCSYTGLPVPLTQMEEWLDQMVARINSLKPKNLLEIGCGTGLLLFQYAGQCETVDAIDLSEIALATIQTEVTRRGWQHVKLLHADALQLSTFDKHSFDTVIINSVIQYFPNELYLTEILNQLIPLVKPGGRIVFGDVRNLDLLNVHTAIVERDHLTQTVEVGELANRVQRRLLQETELCISPAYFDRLPKNYPDLARIDIHIKRGSGDNEMMRYRYDVVITKKSDSDTSSANPEVIEWQAYESLDIIRRQLQSEPHGVLGIYGVPNFRIIDDLKFAEGLKNWQPTRKIDPNKSPGVITDSSIKRQADFEQLLCFAESIGYQVGVTWSQSYPGYLDILFSQDILPAIRAKDYYKQNYVINYPQLNAITEDLSAELRSFLKNTLSDYMIPSLFIAIERMPINTNGKIDKKALPVPQEDDWSRDTYVAPENTIEEQLCELWQAHLNLKKIGTKDNFFLLGGHSLLATRLISAIRQTFNVELPLSVLFESPTVAELAAALLLEQKQFVLPAIASCPREMKLPLSFSQQRLWFIDQFEQGSLQYNMSGSFLLSGRFDSKAFENALKALADRHEILRTRYIAEQGQPSQVIDAEFTSIFTCYDLTDFSETQSWNEVERIRIELAAMPFNLSHDHMFRVSAACLTDNITVIIYSIHHIACDGWSLNILQQDLTTLYKAQIEGRLNPLKPLPVQYADFAIWQRDWLKGEVLNTQINYWKDALRDLPTVHSLPLDKVRPGKQTFNGMGFRAGFSVDLQPQIQEVCRKYDVTLFMFLHSVFSILLAKYSRQKDIVVGTPISGRNHSDTEGLIGFFVNSLILRTQVEGRLTFQQLLQHNKTTLLDAYAHQHVPFETLVEELSPERELGYNALYQIVFSIQTDDQRSTSSDCSNTFSAPDILVSGSETVTTRTDLEVHASDSNGYLSMIWVYNASLFDDVSIRQMASSYQILVENIVEHLLASTKDVLTINKLMMLSEDQKMEQLARSKYYPVASTKPTFLYQQVERNAANDGDAVAVLHENSSVTYRELNDRSNRLARLLIRQGVNAGDCVVLLQTPGIDMVISMLAVQKTGAAYVPLDPSYPQARISDIIDDCGCRHIICTQDNKTLIGQNDLCILQLSHPEIQSELNSFSCKNLAESKQRVHPESVAYVLYTSGSTGRPKGVMVSQRNLANYLEHSKRYLDEEINASVVSTAMTFDATVTSLWTPLCVGISIELLPLDEQLIERLADFISDDEDRLLFKLTPSHLNALLGCHLLEGHRFIRHVFVIGGEKLSTELLLHWQQMFPNATFINEYGPTETTVGCSWYVVDSNTPIKDQWLSVPIGGPIGNTELLVLDDNLNLAPSGVPGQLFIAGEGVSQGYINDPVKSALLFVPNPYSDAPGQVMYQSGDIVRWLPDGKLDFIGRNDNQVKIRGFRVELTEIEAQLRVVSDCKQCVVLATGCSEEQKHLVAFMVHPQSDTVNCAESLSNEELKARLVKHLPSYMIPRKFVWVSEFPLTTNGKVDHKSLLKSADTPDAAGQYAEPRNETETAMCKIWQDILKLDRVGIWDNFFSIGGHSLLATRLISALRQEFSVELTLQSLFSAPCVAELSGKINEYADNFMLPAIAVANRQQMLPLSFAQQRLWFIDQLGEGSAHYNMSDSFIVKGAFNACALKFAFEQVLARHEVLRVNFTTIEGISQQIVSDTADIELWAIDLSHLERESKETTLGSLLEDEGRRPFDLSSDLLLRGGYVLMDAETSLVHYTTHHIISDGRSMEILKRELNYFYNQFDGKEIGSLNPLQIQYVDYAIWQKQWLRGELLSSQMAYWKKQLEGIPQIHSIPLDKPRPATQSFKGRCFTSILPNDTMSRVEALCLQADVTLFMFLHTAFAVLLGRYANQSDIVIGIATEGRIHKDVEDLVGFFVNALVLRTNLSEDPSFSQLLQTNKQTILNAHTHQNVPFEMLVEELHPQRDLSHNPLFQIMFAVHRLDVNVLETSGLLSSADLASALEGTEGTASSTRSDLQVHVNQIGDVVAVMWNYNDSLFEQATMHRLAEGYATLLESVVTELEATSYSGQKKSPISQLDIIGESAATELAKISQGNISLANSDMSFIAQFERQAAQTSNLPAVVIGDESMTYRELNEQANQLAWYLDSQGVTDGSVVALCVEPSLELLVGVLGILKCGAAYVPLDPKLPLSRLEWMLKDCDAALVLTQQALMTELTFEGRKVLPIDSEFRNIMMANCATDNLHRVIYTSQQNLAYIIYTSGSTGTPKGVKVSCQAMQSYCGFALDHYYDAKLDGAIAVTGYNVDMTVPSLFLPLLKGGYVRFLEDGHVLERLSSILKQTDQNYLLRMTPSHALGLLDLLSSETQQDNYHSFILGGEVLHLNTVSQLNRVFHNATIMNHYGPTEAVVGCVLNKEVMNDARCVSGAGKAAIGRPMDNVHLYVLDQQGALALPGAIGELAVSSSRLSSGYLNNAIATTEKFVQAAFPNQLTPLIYKTGDLVRWLPNGNLDFIGRLDEQVQLRGFRIELGEIEAALKTLTDVRESTVAIKQLSQSKEMLVAFIVPKETIYGEDDLAVQQKKNQLTKVYREQLSKRLSDYMIPSVFVFLDELPKTSNGKLDKKRLPAPGETDLQAQEYVAPATEIERSLCQLWQEILELERVGTTDNFFTLGGHSLLGTRLISAIRQQYSVQLPLRILFEFPTVSDLANIIETELLHKEITTSETEEFVL